MKTNQANQLKEFIRAIARQEMKQIIQEEINKAMGKVLVEMVKEIKKPLPSTSKSIVTESVETEEVEEVEQEVQRTPMVATVKTNNPKLSNALAETAKNFRGLPKTPGSSLAELAEEFQKVGDTEEVSYDETPKSNLDFMKSMINESAAPATPSVLDVKNQLPEHLQQLFSGKNLGLRFKKVKESASSVINSGQVGMM